jgi:hypothetical protein
MKKIKLLTCVILSFGITVLKAQIIATYAGNSTAGYSGDGGQATAAELNNPNGVNSDASGNIYIGDNVNNSITYSVRTPPGHNAFIAGFDRWGYFWGTYLGDVHTDIGADITTDGANNLYVVGYTSSVNFPLVQNPSNCYFQGYQGGADAFISMFNVSSITGINSVDKPTNGEIAVYPNPTSQDITVGLELEESEKVEFTLYNLLGEAVYSEEVKEGAGTVNKQISLSLLNDGAYILKVIAGTEIYHQKVVKLK